MHSTRRVAFAHFFYLWLAGNSLRVTMLSIPPLVPAIHHSLALDETAVGVLSSLPVLLLAVAAVPGSLLVARIGARRALVAGLLTVALAGAARGVGTSVLVLFAMTFLMGVGVAVSQPTMPSLVRQWFPTRAGIATAVYSNGYLVGEIAAAGLTAPLILSLVGNWERALSIWSIPVLATALIILQATAHVPRLATAPPLRWWPDWRNPLTWRLGLILGGASAAYWSANAFIPDYLRAIHHPGLITAALTSLNLSQLPVSLIVGAMPGLVIGKRWPVLVAGFLTLVSVPGMSLGGNWVVVMAGLCGFATAAVFVLNLALPPILAAEGDVHRLSAAMFTISYACPFVGSAIGGAIWDLTRQPLTAFTPLAAGGILMTLLVLGMRLPQSGDVQWQETGTG